MPRPSALAGLAIDQQLEARRLQDRQVGGLLALENPAGIDAGLARRVRLRLDRPVAQQPAGLAIFAPGIDRRYGATCRARDARIAPAEEECPRGDKDRIELLPVQ